MLFEDGGGLPHLSFFTYKAKDLVFPAQTDRREKNTHRLLVLHGPRYKLAP